MPATPGWQGQSTSQPSSSEGAARKPAQQPSRAIRQRPTSDRARRPRQCISERRNSVLEPVTWGQRECAADVPVTVTRLTVRVRPRELDVSLGSGDDFPLRVVQLDSHGHLSGLETPSEVIECDAGTTTDWPLGYWPETLGSRSAAVGVADFERHTSRPHEQGARNLHTYAVEPTHLRASTASAPLSAKRDRYKQRRQTFHPDLLTPSDVARPEAVPPTMTDARRLVSVHSSA